MAEAYQIGIALGAAASWSDAAGFADAAELAIVDSDLVHTDLDTTGDTTNGINYLHIRGGGPDIGPANGHLKVEFDATYTTKDNFVYAPLDGGVCYLEIVGGACPVVVAAGVGELHIFASSSGSINTLRVSGSARVYVDASCDINTAMEVSGNAYCEVAHKSADNIPILRVSGAAVVKANRRVVTLYTAETPDVYLYNEVGTALTTAYVDGGTVHPIRGDLATIHQGGGEVNEYAAKYSLTLGSTAYNIRSSRVRRPSPTALVTVSNVSMSFGVGIGGAGVPI